MHLSVKVVSALLLIFSTGNCEEITKNARADISDAVLSILTCVINLLKEGVPEHNVPSLDPLFVEEVRLDPDTEMFKGYLALKNLFLKGILNIKVVDLKADLSVVGGMKLEVDHSLNLENIILETDYSTDLRIFNFLHLYGKGHLSAKLSDLGISGRVVIAIVDESIEISKFSLKLSLGGSQINITGLLNDEHMSEMISNALSDLLPQLIQEHSEELSKIIIDLIQSLAGDIDFEKIMEILAPCLKILFKMIK